MFLPESKPTDSSSSPASGNEETPTSGASLLADVAAATQEHRHSIAVTFPESYVQGANPMGQTWGAYFEYELGDENTEGFLCSCGRRFTFIAAEFGVNVQEVVP